MLAFLVLLASAKFRITRELSLPKNSNNNHVGIFKADLFKGIHDIIKNIVANCYNLSEKDALWNIHI